MAFWIFMTAMICLLPLTMIYFGKRFRSLPPKSINLWYGYRTRRSMQNRDTWVFAHHHLGRIWHPLGWVMLVVSAAAMAGLLGRDMDTIALWATVLIFVQTVPMILPVISTERALKRTFDQYGRRR